MCVILYAQNGRPHPEAIERAEQANDDGMGFAWTEGGMTRWEKGVDLASMQKAALELPLPFVLHFRIATVGPACPELCHPFPVTPACETKRTGRAKSVLFHNGGWGGWRSDLMHALIALGGKYKSSYEDLWSDSRAMAFMAGNYGIGMLDFLDLGQSRVLILHGDGNVNFFGEWHEVKDKGWWYSNPNFVKELYPPLPKVVGFRKARRNMEPATSSTPLDRILHPTSGIWMKEDVMRVEMLIAEALAARGIDCTERV